MRRGRTGHRWTPPTVPGLRRTAPVRVMFAVKVEGVNFLRVKGIAEYRFSPAPDKATRFRTERAARVCAESFILHLLYNIEVVEVPPT